MNYILKMRYIVATLLAGLAVPGALADKIVAGPKGGRLLEATPSMAEFFVTPDKRVEITFYDAELKAVAPEAQVVSVTAETPAGRKALDMERSAEGFLSKQPLPEGAPYRVVVQVRPAAGEKPQNFRVDLNLALCGECARAEYACLCEGH